MQLRVQKWPGMEEVEVLQEALQDQRAAQAAAAAGPGGEAQGDKGLWGSVKSLFGGEPKKVGLCCWRGGCGGWRGSAAAPWSWALQQPSKEAQPRGWGWGAESCSFLRGALLHGCPFRT
jgi:hypothetical protein